MIGNKYRFREFGSMRTFLVITPEEAAKGMDKAWVNQVTDPEYVFVKDVDLNTTRSFNKKLLLEEGHLIDN